MVGQNYNKYNSDEICYNIFFHHTTRGSTCDTLASSAANQGDNTVSVAQGGATETVLSTHKKNIVLYYGV